MGVAKTSMRHTFLESVKFFKDNFLRISCSNFHNVFASEGKNLKNDSPIDRDALAVNCWFSSGPSCSKSG